MNHLFGEFGLVIIDGNDLELKKEFKPIVAKELKEGLVYKAFTLQMRHSKQKAIIRKFI